MAERNSSGFWVGLVMGAALGTVAGLLLAPQKGRETRRELQNSLDALPNATQDQVDQLQVQANGLLTQARRQVDEVLVRLQEAVDAGKKATQEYRERPANGTGPTP